MCAMTRNIEPEAAKYSLTSLSKESSASIAFINVARSLRSGGSTISQSLLLNRRSCGFRGSSLVAR